MDIGKNITKFRKAKKLTQEELANLICVSPKTISSYENNRNLPNIEMLISLSEVLGVSINDILGSKEEALGEYQKHHHKNILMLLLISITSCIYFMLFSYMSIGSITYLKEVKSAFDNGLRNDLYSFIIMTGIWYLIICFMSYFIWYVSYKKFKNYRLYQVLISIISIIIFIITLVLFL